MNNGMGYIPEICLVKMKTGHSSGDCHEKSNDPRKKLFTLQIVHNYIIYNPNHNIFIHHLKGKNKIVINNFFLFNQITNFMLS